MKVYVGCCGFAKGMKIYFQTYDTVEVQKTFYRLPRESTLEKWRNTAPSNFIFNLKVFQGITHDVKSPTWKKSGIKNYRELSGRVGYLRPTEEVFEYWDKMLKYAEIVKARVLVIQLPASFRDVEENWRNAGDFFAGIKRDGFLLGVELRGWSIDRVEEFCRRFELIDVCDLMVRTPTFLLDEVAYFRLHGSYVKGRINYRHKYSDEELQKLAELISKLDAKEVFLMFNNIYMGEDSLRFREIWKGYK